MKTRPEDCYLKIMVSPPGTERIHEIHNVLLPDEFIRGEEGELVKKCLDHMVYNLVEALGVIRNKKE